ncbi:MAG: CHAD domain-containing protein [Gemmatimonadaceae bacterium]
MSTGIAETSEAATRGARRVALSLLADVRSARTRLGTRDDREALHDFRVAVRRLRSWMRMMAEDLSGSYPRGVRDALRAFGQQSNAGRDAEVLLEWLTATMPRLAPRHRRAARWLEHQHRSRGHDANQALATVLDESFEPVIAKLERRLRRFKTTVWLDETRAEPTLAQRVGTRANAQGARLRDLLSRVQGVDDDDAIHQARIAGKRLRYLLEPLRGAYPSLTPLIERLKRLQDSLGAVHDAHVWGAALHHTLQSAADEEGRSLRRVASGAGAHHAPAALPSRAGLMALAGRMHEHAASEFESFRADWIEDATSSFFTELTAATALLLERAQPMPMEIERKYLLRRMPRQMPRARVALVHQGYLPGEHIVERLRRTTRGRRTEYTRTIKLGAGLSRAEFEESVSQTFFEGIWPLTEGKRVLKRRHAVRHGAQTWEIDEFLDRDLVLAEVELSDVEEQAPLPPWLRRYVVREVTDEAEYVNYRLAR